MIMTLFHTLLAVGILVGFFDGVEREFSRLVKKEEERERYSRRYML